MKQIIDIVEVSEIGIDLDDPIRPAKNDGDDVEHGNATG